MMSQFQKCSEAERWARPAKYAVMKKGRKRAVKLHDDELEALGHCGITRDRALGRVSQGRIGAVREVLRGCAVLSAVRVRFQTNVGGQHMSDDDENDTFDLF